MTQHQYVDFYDEEIKPGDWVYIMKSSGGYYMRYGKAVRVGSTGRMLFQVYCVSGARWEPSANTRLIPIADTELLTWKIKPEMLPSHLKKYLFSKGLTL